MSLGKNLRLCVAFLTLVNALFLHDVLIAEPAQCSAVPEPIECPVDPRERHLENSSKGHYFSEFDPNSGHAIGSEHRKAFDQELKAAQEAELKNKDKPVYSPEFLGLHSRLQMYFGGISEFKVEDLATIVEKDLAPEFEEAKANSSPDVYMSALAKWLEKQATASGEKDPQKAFEKANVEFTKHVANRFPEVLTNDYFARTPLFIAQSVEAKHKEAPVKGFVYANSSDLFEASILSLYQNRYESDTMLSSVDKNNSLSKHDEVAVKPPDAFRERSVTVVRDGTQVIKFDAERPLVEGFRSAATETFFAKIPWVKLDELKKLGNLPSEGKAEGTSSQKIEALLAISNCEDYKTAQAKLAGAYPEFFKALNAVAWRQVALAQGVQGAGQAELWCEALKDGSVSINKVMQDSVRVLFSNHLASLLEVKGSAMPKAEDKVDVDSLGRAIDMAGLLKYWKVTNPALAQELERSIKNGNSLKPLLGDESTHDQVSKLIPSEYYRDAYGYRSHGLGYEKADDIGECHKNQIVACVTREWMNQVSHENFDKMSVDELNKLRENVFDSCVAATGLKSEALKESAGIYANNQLEQVLSRTLATKNLHDVYNENYDNVSDDPDELASFAERSTALNYLKEFGLNISKKGHLGVDAAVDFSSFHGGKVEAATDGFPIPPYEEIKDKEKLEGLLAFMGKAEKTEEEQSAFIELIRASSVGNIMGEPPSPDSLQKMGEWYFKDQPSIKTMDWRQISSLGLPEPVVMGRSVFIPYIHFDRSTRSNVKRVRVVDIADWEAEAIQALGVFQKSLKGKLEAIQEAGVQAASGAHQIRKVIPGAIGYGALRAMRWVSGGILFPQSGSAEGGELLVKYGTKEFEALSGAIQDFELALNKMGDRIPLATQRLGIRGALGSRLTGDISLNQMHNQQALDKEKTVESVYNTAKDKFVSVGLQLATLPLLIEGGGVICGGISRLVAARGLTQAAKQRILAQGVKETAKWGYKKGVQAGRIAGGLNTLMGAGFGAGREYLNPWLNHEEREVKTNDLVNTALAAIPELRRKVNPETGLAEDYDYAEYSKAVMQTLVMTGALTGFAGPLGEKTYFALKGPRAAKMAFLKPLVKTELRTNVTANLGVSVIVRGVMYGGQQTEAGRLLLGETRSGQVKKAIEESAKTLDGKRAAMLEQLSRMRKAPGQSEEDFQADIALVKKEVETIEQSVAMLRNPTWEASMADVAQDVIPDILFAAAGARYYREGNRRVSVPEAKSSMNKMLLHQASVSSTSTIKPLANGDVQVKLGADAMGRMKTYAHKVHEFYTFNARQFDKPKAGSFRMESSPKAIVDEGWKNLSSADKHQILGRFVDGKTKTFTIPAAEVPAWYTQTAKVNKPLADAMLIEFSRHSNPTIVNPFLIQEYKAKP